LQPPFSISFLLNEIVFSIGVQFHQGIRVRERSLRFFDFVSLAFFLSILAPF